MIVVCTGSKYYCRQRLILPFGTITFLLLILMLMLTFSRGWLFLQPLFFCCSSRHIPASKQVGCCAKKIGKRRPICSSLPSWKHRACSQWQGEEGCAGRVQPGKSNLFPKNSTTRQILNLKLAWGRVFSELCTHTLLCQQYHKIKENIIMMHIVMTCD